jgi:hypothetical protein
MASTKKPAETPQSPAQLFIDLWKKAERWRPDQRTTAPRPDASFIDSANQALEQPTAQAAYDALQALLAHKTPTQEKHGRILAVMQAIDRMFIRIHPRAPVVATAAGPRPRIPEWLGELRDIRSMTGDYGKTKTHRLIARGPLLRASRVEAASGGDSLADRYAALAVVPTTLPHEGRPIRIRHRCIAIDAGRGVACGHRPGEETVAFIPVAELSDDLESAVGTFNGRSYADYRIHPGIDPAERILQALDAANAVEPVDIAIGPEFVVSEAHADSLQARLPSPKRLFRLIVAGSGPTRTVDAATGMAWNEARILNGSGAELWRQRKIWPSQLTHSRAVEYQLPVDPNTGGPVWERNAAGVEVVIADADGLGRCVVLICQDIQCLPFTEDLLRQFQPDWVFTPVLDPGVEAGRWAHQRAFALSGLSNTRFLVASSLSLAKRLKLASEPACGLAVGSKTSADADKGRLCAAVKSSPGVSPACAMLTWRSGAPEWKESTLSMTGILHTPS